MNVNGASNIYNELGLSRQQDNQDASKGLGQNDFLKLMIAQFRNQSPLNPMKGSKFLGQLAQFGTVSGIDHLQNSFSGLAQSLESGRALKAAGLVGHQVLVPGRGARLSEGGSLNGAVKVPPGGGDVKVIIQNARGRQVRQIDLGEQPAGLAAFSWGGQTTDGGNAPPGNYGIKAVRAGEGQSQALDTLISGPVASVSLAQGQVHLAVPGVGDVSLSDVREIGA